MRGRTLGAAMDRGTYVSFESTVSDGRAVFATRWTRRHYALASGATSYQARQRWFGRTVTSLQVTGPSELGDRDPHLGFVLRNSDSGLPVPLSHQPQPFAKQRHQRGTKTSASCARAMVIGNATDIRRICPSRSVLSNCSACPCQSHCQARRPPVRWRPDAQVTREPYPTRSAASRPS
jgi:hypothetical protein